ncbi:MAG: permease [Moraxellaceae bacterium]|nr:permease [Moraxellaceae bacterium]
MNLDIIILFFGLGAFAGLVRTDMRLPEGLYETLSLYLLLALGLKGGMELARFPIGSVLLQAIPVVALGVLLPLLCYPVLRRLGRLPVADSASIAAHYGSVSVATFAVGVAHLDSLGIAYEAYLPVFVVLLEMPAIGVGIWLARRAGIGHGGSASIAHEIFLNKGILLMGGGLLIGAIAGPEGVEPIAPVFVDLFKGALALFLVEMGFIAASRLKDLRELGVFLLAFGTLMPLTGAFLGALAGTLAGLSPGGVIMVATLGASASYIAVPAAMRIAIPEARHHLSITLSLAITFPFNVLVGIPLYTNLLMR